MKENEITEKIISMERAALEEWNKGNPTPFLDLLAEEITYFDPFQEKRINGFLSMKKFYEGLKGKMNVTRYEIIEPVVQLNGNVAVLSYHLDSYSGNVLYKWNCTEVYVSDKQNKWKIIHNHWSFIRPGDIPKE